MADDRPADDTTSAVAQLRREFEDKMATALARANRRPVGTIEPTLRSTAPTGTLLCQGQTVNRSDYPDLWAWAQDVGAVTGGLFGNGNGSTTFTLPDLRGRVPIGVGTLGSDTYALGATGGEARHTLTSAEIPAHDHGGVGDHPGHQRFPIPVQAGSGANDVMCGPALDEGAHTHASFGGGGAHENRPPFVAVSWVIYT